MFETFLIIIQVSAGSSGETDDFILITQFNLIPVSQSNWSKSESVVETSRDHVTENDLTSRFFSTFPAIYHNHS